MDYGIMEFSNDLYAHINRYTDNYPFHFLVILCYQSSDVSHKHLINDKF
jgi:hypothetical protein